MLYGARMWEFVWILFVGLVVLGVLALAGGRKDPDPEGHRPYALYLFAVSFIALFLMLSGGAAMVDGLARAGLPEQSVPPQPEGSLSFVDLFQPDARAKHVADAVEGGLLAIAAFLVLRFHGKRSRDLVGRPGFQDGPAWRVHQVYLYAVCFTAIVVALFGAVSAVSASLVIGWPDTFATGNNPYGGLSPRSEGIATLVTEGLLAGAALWIFLSHWRRATGGTAPSEGSDPAVEAGTP